MNPRAALCALALAAAAACGAAGESSLGLAVFSTGSWSVYGAQDGFTPRPYRGDLERYDFNKILALGLYGRVLGLPAYAGLPLCWTAKRAVSGDTSRVAPGDLELYLGKRLGRVEARLGALVPAGYDTEDGNPWIGPGNVQVTLGAAANPNITRYSKLWEASAEAKWAYALTDGVAKAGSWGLYPLAKLSYRPVQRWKTGLELSGEWKSQYWGKAASFSESVLGKPGAAAQWSAGAVATAFGEAYLRPGLAAGVKAGHSFWGYRDASSFNASLYLLVFP